MSTRARWLTELGLIGQRPKRARRGPVLNSAVLTLPRGPNDVWTIDFKGWFRTGDGVRVDPLTVRDLFSRYVLGVALLAGQRDEPVRAFMKKLFLRFGLPKVIRVDHGAPFAGVGPLDLSRLSVWWLRLGIGVEFTGRGAPQDNAAHEQMHRVLKAETATPPARSLRAQEIRTPRWVRCYNQQRPHEALEQRTPARLYRRSPRPFPRVLPPLPYPQTWASRRVRPQGDVKWRGRLRFIGRAFVGQKIGVKTVTPGIDEVYLARQWIGQLHEADESGMRPCHFVTNIP